MTDDHKAIEEANTGFYRAFEALDLRAMETCGARRARPVRAPRWPLLIGWGRCGVLEAIFADTQEMSFSLTDVRARAPRPRLGYLHREHPVETDGRVGVTAILATNLFERSPDREGGGGWRMVHHHASHC